MSPEARVAATGLLSGPVVVLLSGGRDSVCLLDLAVRLAGPVVALHVNYGLRDEADADEAYCAALCARLGVPLEVRRAGEPRGNVQAWAREVRYAAAEELEGVIAAGHTATDQAETVLYRLLASPGRRALLGMPARSGRVVRPLLEVTRAETAAYCRERGLEWREDASNATSTRGRIRALLDLHPAAEANVLRTLETLRDEAAVLDAAVDDALVSDFATLPPALARLVLQRLADEAGGPSIAAHADAILALARKGGTAALDLPGGLRATSEYGRVKITRVGTGDEGGREPAAGGSGVAAGVALSAAAGGGGVAAGVALSVPGRVAFAGGELSCELGAFPVADGTLAAGPLARTLTVRAWQRGDRMRPLGLGGSKSVQDLFTDRKVPRARRGALPVVVSDGEIAWIPGVATGERFRVTDATATRARLVWRAP